MAEGRVLCASTCLSYLTVLHVASLMSKYDVVVVGAPCVPLHLFFRHRLKQEHLFRAQPCSLLLSRAWGSFDSFEVVPEL